MVYSAVYITTILIQSHFLKQQKENGIAGLGKEPITIVDIANLAVIESPKNVTNIT